MDKNTKNPEFLTEAERKQIEDQKFRGSAADKNSEKQPEHKSESENIKEKNI